MFFFFSFSLVVHVPTYNSCINYKFSISHSVHDEMEQEILCCVKGPFNVCVFMKNDEHF